LIRSKGSFRMRPSSALLHKFVETNFLESIRFDIQGDQFTFLA
jgi:hypothetical protein